MNFTDKLNGSIAVINTPFNPDYTIDYDSLGRYISHSLECGVSGFLALGMAAEINKLSIEEKEKIVRTVIGEVNGRVPVICGTSAKSRSERLLLTEKFIRLGSDGIMANVPYENEISFSRQIHEISELHPGFLMIQDWDHTGFGIPVDVITKLFREIKCFRCYKIEVVPAGIKYTAALASTGSLLHVSGGWASSQMIEALDRGVHAFMSTILHDIYLAIFRLHRAGNRESAKYLFHELVPVLAFSHQHLDISIHFNKRLVKRLGLFTTDYVREPILPFDEFHIRVADELIDKAIALSGKLKNGQYEIE